MSTATRIITGIVKDGVIVPKVGSNLVDGTQVNIIISEQVLTPDELQEELTAWQQAGMTSWQMIEEWERDEQ
jgi:hypothetical protein